MSQGPLCPNLTKKGQAEVSQMANRNLSRVILLGGLSVNLNHLKMDPEKKVLQHVREVGMEEGSDDEEPSGSKLPGPNIVLNSTSEFCRTLGDIPTYGQAGNREEDEEELLVCINHSVSGLNDSL